MKNIKSLEEFNSSEINEAKDLARIDKGDPEKEIRIVDHGSYITIMQRNFDYSKIDSVVIGNDQIPKLIAALKKAK